MSKPPDAETSWNIRLPTPRALARVALVAGAVVVIVALFIAAGSAIAPFVIGLVLAYLMLPLVNKLNQSLPRWAAILIVYVLVFVIFLSVILLIVPPLIGQIQQLIMALSNPRELSRLIAELNAWYERTIPSSLQSPIASTLDSLIPTIRNNLSTIAQSVGQFVLRQLSGVVGVVSFLFGLLVVPIWLFYVMNDSRRGGVFINRLLPYQARRDFWNAWELINRSLSAYIRGQLTLGVIIGVAMWAGLIILDFIPGIEIDYILLLAIWAGIAELIPMVGALLGGIPAVIVALFVGGPVSALAVLVWVIIIQFAENNFLVPRIIGESVGVHPAILLVALVVFSQVLGFVGVVLAAPLTAIARDLYLYAYRRLNGNSPTETMNSLGRAMSS
jgi:predicted PurR-regulated permease PerM